MKVSLFYLIHPDYTNSRENWVFSRHFSAFCGEFLSRLLHVVSQAKQSKQLLTKEIRILLEETKYICSKKRAEMQFILFD